MRRNAPVRVLHSVGSMNRGGIETSLIHLLRRIDRRRFRMDFLVRTSRPAAYDSEVESLGSKVIACPDPTRPWQFIPALKKALREHGPYDIVHCYSLHYATGAILHYAAQMGIPGRIAHSRDDATYVASMSVAHRIAAAITRRLVRKHAVIGLAISSSAAQNMFGPNWKSDRRVAILPGAVDFDPFHERVDPREVRAQLGIPDNAFVVGHVGRFDEVKNYGFIIKTMQEVVREQPDAYLLLIGDGPLRPQIERNAAEAGVRNRTIFAGSRSDVPRLLLGAVDVFVFPSLSEGLGLAVIEAQAAGLPCVCSDGVPAETDVVHSLVNRMSLGQPAAEWARRIVGLRNTDRIAQPGALETVEGSLCNVRANVRELENVYSRFAAQ